MIMMIVRCREIGSSLGFCFDDGILVFLNHTIFTKPKKQSMLTRHFPFIGACLVVALLASISLPTQGAIVIDPTDDDVYYGTNSDGTGATQATNGMNWDPVAGNASNHLFVGLTAKGQLNISAGDDVSNDGCSVAHNSSSQGEVTITGAGSTWDLNSYCYVGNSGTGKVTISNGAVVSSRDSHIGKTSSGVGTVTVTGAGSTWTTTEEIMVGDAGKGTLIISDGGYLSNTVSYIANSASGNGTVTVTGEGSTWNSRSNFFVGYVGTGVVNLEAGGRIIADMLFDIRASGTFNWTGGTFELNGWTSDTIPETLESGMFLAGTGALNGNTNFTINSGGGVELNGVRLTGAGAGGFAVTLTAAKRLRSASYSIPATGRINASAALDLSNITGLQIVVSTGNIESGATKMQVNGGITLPAIASCDFQVPAGIPIGNGTTTVIDATAEIQVAGAETMDDLLADLNTGLAKDFDWWYDSSSFDLMFEYSGYIPPTGDDNDSEIERAYGPAITKKQIKQVKDGATACTAAAGSSFGSSRLVGQAIRSHLAQTYQTSQWAGNNEGSIRGQCCGTKRSSTLLWAQTLGAWANQDAIDTMTSSVETNIFGIAVGAERSFGSRLIGGVAFGGTWSQSTSGDARSDADMLDIELYSSYRFADKWRLNGGIGYQYNDYSNRRIQGADTYTSNHAGNMFKGNLFLERDWHLYGVRVTPIYGWEYYNLQQHGYTETGGTTPQTIDFNRTEAVFQRVGTQVGLFNRGRLSVNLDAAWLHNFGDATILLGGLVNGNPINLEGIPLHKDLAEMGIDCNVRLSRRLDLSLGYTATLASGFDLHTIDGVLAWTL